MADRFGLRPVLGGALVTVAAAVALLLVSSSPAQALAALAILGIGGAGTNTTTNALVSALFPERRTVMLTWLAVAAGLGGAALPLLMLAGGSGWSVVLLGTALLALLLSAAATRVEEARVVHAFSWSGVRDVIGAPAFGWYLLALVCQGGNEAALAGWLTPHLTIRGLPGPWPLVALTSHWVGIIAGRLCMAVVVDRLGTRLTILTGAIVASLGTLLLIALQGEIALVAAATLAGFGISGVFSVVMADAGARYPRRAATMFAALIAAGQVGGVILPWSVGRTAERTGLDAGLALVVVTTLAVGAIAVRVTTISAWPVARR